MGDYVQDGDLWDYTPGSAVAAGDVVVINDTVGVAPRPIAANKLGAVAVEGVFVLPKTANQAIGQGKIVYWNASGSVITTAADSGGQTPTAYVRVGKAAVAALAADSTVKVALNIG